MAEKKSPILYCNLLKDTSYELFQEIYSYAPRASRMIIAKRCGVKKSNKCSIAQMKQRNEKLISDIYAAMLDNNDHQLAEQLIKNWLYQKRPMLKAALDYMNIPNEDGLTDNDLDAFETLSEEDCKKLQDFLTKDFPAEHVYVYLKFLNVPFVTLNK